MLENKNKLSLNRAALPFTEDISDAPDSELVCYCSEVTKGDILAAKGRGTTALEGIKKATEACTMAAAGRQIPGAGDAPGRS